MRVARRRRHSTAPIIRRHPPPPSAARPASCAQASLGRCSDVAHRRSLWLKNEPGITSRAKMSKWLKRLNLHPKNLICGVPNDTDLAPASGVELIYCRKARGTDR